MKKHIPNLLTLGNLLSGCIGVVFAVNGQLSIAAYFVFLGIFFDFFDGFAARALKVSSPLGLQLDSLADLVTSGLVPGIAMMQLLHWSEANSYSHLQLWIEETDSIHWFPILGLLITLGSAYRLAKFNIDENQTSSFIGLPTPANALLILSLPLILEHQPVESIQNIITNPYFLVVLTLFSTFILNARLPLFALKFKNWSFQDNWYRYVLLCLSVVCIIVFQFAGIPLIILCYLLLSTLVQRSKA